MRQLLGLLLVVLVALLCSPVHATIGSGTYSGILDISGGVAWGVDGEYGVAPDGLTATFTGEFTYDIITTGCDYYPLLTLTWHPQGDSAADGFEVGPMQSDILNMTNFYTNYARYYYTTNTLQLGVNLAEIGLANYLGIDTTGFGEYSSSPEHGYLTVTSIAVNNPVPEPATMFLLGSGLVGLAGLRRKFRKN